MVSYNPKAGILQMMKQKVKPAPSLSESQMNSLGSPDNQRRRLGTVMGPDESRGLEEDRASIATDSSLSQLSLEDVYDFYQMLNDYQDPIENKEDLVPQRRNSDQ